MAKSGVLGDIRGISMESQENQKVSEVFKVVLRDSTVFQGATETFQVVSGIFLGVSEGFHRTSESLRVVSEGFRGVSEGLRSVSGKRILERFLK